MTFSLKLGFNLTDKRGVMISADRAIVYMWRDGELENSFVFPADETGFENFARYLRETSNSPIYLLVDIVEEEYRQDTIPHVFGADRRSVLARKQARLFRGTSYTHAIIQGRERGGRRDDRVLLTALTKPDIIAPWFDIITRHKAPLAGIYSLPLLSQQLLPKMGANGENVLLITLQGASGLRQTFFRGGQFKISRLAPMPRLGTVPFFDHLAGELDKLQRYLSSLGLPDPDQPLDIYILSHGEYLDELEANCRDTNDYKYYLVDIADIARKIGVQGIMTTPYSDTIYAHSLLKNPPRNQYARGGETQNFNLHQTRLGLLAASVILMLGAVAWGGLNFIEGVSFKQQALDAQSKAAFYRARYEIAHADLPPTPVEAPDILAAVDIVATLQQYKTSPVAMLRTIGSALDDAANVHVRQINWITSTDPNKREMPGARSSQRPNNVGSIPRDKKYLYYQIARIEGYIDPFNGDYRTAIDQVQDFVERLRRENDVYDVRIITWPVNTSSATSLSGSAADSARAGQANFAVRIVLGEVGAA